MKILALDTTAKVASVAVLEDGRALAEYSVDNGLTQSELILPMAEDILKQTEKDWKKIIKSLKNIVSKLQSEIVRAYK